MTPPARRDTADRRRAAIQEAAITEFSDRGFAATSMATIAEAAGLSRPALYQYFRNKDDIFAAAFVGLFDAAVDAALAALSRPGSPAEQLDGYLQRFEGDLWQRMQASPHSDEIMAHKHRSVAAALGPVLDRRSAGLEHHLATIAPGRSAGVQALRADWFDLLALSPSGYKADQPPVEVYRRRLTALATSVAAAIAASTAPVGTP